MQLTAGKWRGLTRMADRAGRFEMVAVDQRPPIENPIAAKLGADAAPWEEVARFKRLLVEKLQADSTALLLDPHYAIPAAIEALDPAKGLIVTLESSVFSLSEGGGRLSSEIDDWSVGKIRRMGGDAVKALAWWRPDAPLSVRRAQQDFAKRVGEACAEFDMAFLFELLVYPLATDREEAGDYVEMRSKRVEHVLASVEEFAKPDYGVDVFKLESPIAAKDALAAEDPARVQKLFDEMGALAGRPWVMLSAGAGKREFAEILRYACKAGASGFLAGRAIWLDAFGAYPDWSEIERRLEERAVPYMRELAEIAETRARPWFEHPCWGEGGARFSPSDASFRHGYADLARSGA